MKYYLYDESTREYIGESSGELMPQNALETEPPLINGTGKVVVDLRTREWVVIPQEQPSLIQAEKSARSRVDAAARAIVDKVVGDYTEWDRDAFPTKEAEARAILAADVVIDDPLVVAPLLAREYAPQYDVLMEVARRIVGDDGLGGYALATKDAVAKARVCLREGNVEIDTILNSGLSDEGKISELNGIETGDRNP